MELFNVGAMMESAKEFQFFMELGLILLAATAGGALAKKTSMPPVLGQIIVGILIGPTCFAFLKGEDELIHLIAQLGVVFLMFLAGLETDLKQLKATGKGASMIALGGILFPFTLGAVVSYFGFRQYIPGNTVHLQTLGAIYIGTILTATSVSISVSVLRDMKQLGSKQGISILGAAIIDDVLGIVLLAIVSGMINPSGDTNIAILIIRMVIFFVFTIILGIIVNKGVNIYARRNHWRERIVTVAIVLCFMCAFIAEMFSVAAITGAYAAGVMIASTPYRHRVIDKVQTVAYSLFTPIFFVSIGISVKITSEIFDYIGYAIVIVVIAIIAKAIGCFLGAKASGFSQKHSVQIGIGMIARAEVALIVANEGYLNNIISNQTFTAVVLIVVVSTILTPPLLKMSFKGEAKVAD